MSHTKECEEQTAKRLAARKAWIKLWPNYCKICGGLGAHYVTYDPSPAGVSLSPGFMIDVEFCSDCAEKGICSRCGEKVCDLDHIQYICPNNPCPKCGWDGKDHMPPEPECYCDFMNVCNFYGIGN